ncbi:thiol reductant ABC exporter subunit CydD [Streptomyces sp. NPDC088745]|uniref:thiol reductant ABC exporter subunit CydD n=1 Tax=Streptomyces sp. NPDC088745 TaxID=3365884 RepID=UPI0037F7662F
MRTVEQRLLREVPSLRRHVLCSTGLALVGGGLTVAQAALLAGLLADGFGGQGTDLRAPALAAAVMAARALVTWVRGVLAQRAAADAKRALRDLVTGSLRRTNPLRLAAGRHGESATLLTRGLDALDPYVVGHLPAKAAASVVPVVVLGWLAWTDWASALVVLVTLPLIPVFGALVGMHTARRTARQWQLLARLGGHFLDVVAGLPTLRAFGRERHQAAVVREMAQAHRRATLRTLRVAFLSSLVLETVATLSVALVAVPVGLRLLGGEVELYVALTVLFLAPEAYAPLRALGSAFHDGAEGVEVAEKVFAVLDAEGPGGRAPRPEGRLPVPGGDRVPLSLEGVTVRYPGRSGPAVAGVSLTVRAGEHVALVGPSGAGKSTLLALLLGFVEPGEGRVAVGGVDLKDLDAEAWRERVAWVPQRPHLFAGTVAENIRLGRPGASGAEVRAAARAARAEGFVAELPDGYDTVLGEGGAGLSAGQRQRIALARAFLKDAPVVLLDEPTAHLDVRSEGEVVRAMRELMRGRTVLVVAHRAGVLPHVDRVVGVAPPVGGALVRRAGAGVGEAG